MASSKRWPARVFGRTGRWGMSWAVLAAFAYPAGAYACPPPTNEQVLCVAFTAVELPVPISPGTALAIGVVLAIGAALALRRRGRLLASVLAAGLVAAGVDPVGDAAAVPPPPTPLALTSSPASLTVVNTTGSPNPYYVEVSNPHRIGVRIDLITLTPGTPPPPSYTISPGGTTCAVGMTLASGGTCQIELVKPST